LLLPHFC